MAGALSNRGAWLSGLSVGAAGGFASLEIPSVGWLILVAFLVPALASRTRAASLGGLLVGAGAVWIALLSRVAITCEPPDCFAPDIGPWLAAGAAFLTAGLALSAAAARHR